MSQDTPTVDPLRFALSPWAFTGDEIALVRKRLEEAMRAALSATQPAQAAQSEPAAHWHRLYLEKCQQYNDRIAQLGAEIDDLEHAVANACHRLKAQAQQAGEVVTDARIIREVLKAGGTQYGEEDRYIDIESSELVAAVRAILATTPPAPAQPADYWQGEYERVFAEHEACKKQHNDMLHDAIETVTRENHKATQGIGNLHIIAGKRHGDIVTTTAAQPVQGVPEFVSLSARIRELITEHGTLRAVSRSLGIDVGYLSRLEHGDKVSPSPEVLAKLGMRDAGTLYERLTSSPTPPAQQGEPT